MANGNYAKTNTSFGFFVRDGGSRPEVFCRKGFLRNVAKLTEKHHCQSLFFDKVAGLSGTLAQVFFCEFSEISKTPFFTEHLWWLPLKELSEKVFVAFYFFKNT